jgi:Domain of unknown function (DUF4371)
MKRYLVTSETNKTESTKNVKLDDSGSDGSGVLLAMHDADTNTDDLTNTPDDTLLSEAGRYFSGRHRVPQLKWFTDYPWLQMSKSKKAVLCSWCIEAVNCRVFGTKTVDSSFIDKGFSNWKDGATRIHEHSLSMSHRAAASFAAQKNQVSVAAQLNTQMANDQEACRKRLIAELNVIIFLMRQGLAMRRGNDESNDNLHQLLQLLARSGVKEAKDCLTQRVHLSNDIVNELCNIIGQTLLRMLTDQFKSEQATSKYSILADETRDLSGAEQLTICIRWVDKDLSVHEDLLGMYSLKGVGQTAETVTKCLKDVLIRCQLPFEDLHGQGYDGASTMSGAISGVAQRMKESSPNAHFIHCMAHCLNLAISDSGKTVPLLQTALDLVHHLVTFIRLSAKRTDVLNRMQMMASIDVEELEAANTTMHINSNTSLRPLCPTRWTVRASAISSVLVNYEHLLAALQHIGSDRTTPADAASTARGLQKTLQSTEAYFSCVVAHRLFALTDAFAKSIQSPTMTITEVLRRKRHVLNELLVFREQFDIFFDNAVAEAVNLDLDEIQLPRRRRVPARLVEGN